MLGGNVSYADVKGPFAGGSAWDSINPRKAVVGSGGAVTGPGTTAQEQAITGGSPVMTVLLMLGALIVLGWIVNSSSALMAKVGVVTAPIFWLMSILGTMVGIVIVKLLLRRFPVPGLTPVVEIV
jgi:hypothetical protein